MLDSIRSKSRPMSPQTEKMARAPSPSKDKKICSICLGKLSFCFTLDNFFLVTFFLVTFLNQVSSNNKSNFPVHCLLDPKGIPLPCSLFETQLQVNFIWFKPTDSVSNLISTLAHSQNRHFINQLNFFKFCTSRCLSM